MVKVAEMLKCPWDLAIVRKIQVPGNTEAGFDATTGYGDILLNEPLIAQLGSTDEQTQRKSAKVRTELAGGATASGGSMLPELTGKTVILVDEGLASGFTMMVAFFPAKKLAAAGTVVAVPTALRRCLATLGEGAGQIYCASIWAPRLGFRDPSVMCNPMSTVPAWPCFAAFVRTSYSGPRPGNPVSGGQGNSLGDKR